jgi:CRP/FNR family transcriptional regulator
MAIKINAKFLEQLKSLSSFAPSQLDELAANLSVKILQKNESVFDQDEEAKLIYLLLSGVVRESYLNTNQKQTIVNLLAAGEFFGLDSLVPKSRHAFRCEAVENCTLGFIQPRTLIEILLGIPHEMFLRWYTATMLHGRRMYIHCIRGIGLDLRRRLAMELMNLADRFGRADARGTVILLNISHEVLAGIVGASRQQVTEYLNEFDREKIISREGRRIIINSQKLRKILEIAP